MVCRAEPDADITVLVEKPLASKDEKEPETAERFHRGIATHPLALRHTLLGNVLSLGRVTAIGAVVRRIQPGQEMECSTIKSRDNCYVLLSPRPPTNSFCTYPDPLCLLLTMPLSYQAGLRPNASVLE